MVTINVERPDTLDGRLLNAELEDHMAPSYLAVSRHGYIVEKLIAQGVAFFVLRMDETVAGCGGIQRFDVGEVQELGELKRIYVLPSFRGQRLDMRLFEPLEATAREHEVRVVRLETGIHQPDAMRLCK